MTVILLEQILDLEISITRCRQLLIQLILSGNFLIKHANLLLLHFESHGRAHLLPILVIHLTKLVFPVLQPFVIFLESGILVLSPFNPVLVVILHGFDLILQILFWFGAVAVVEFPLHWHAV